MSEDEIRIYKVWSGIKNRCTNPNNQRYKDYGLRGITVCDKWLSFNGFREDMFDSYKHGLQIDRIDNNKGYSKENCRWATPKEQANNTRHIEKAKKFLYDGSYLTVRQLSEVSGISRETLSKRLLKLKWSVERAIGVSPDYANKPVGYSIGRDKSGRFIKSH